jgi:hypothetical protein
MIIGYWQYSDKYMQFITSCQYPLRICQRVANTLPDLNKHAKGLPTTFETFYKFAVDGQVC